jgi:archaeosine synthase
MLKILDKEYFQIIRKETPLMQKNKIIKSIGPSSYRRPDFVEFRNRVSRIFEPEAWTNLILLLPCSSKKPYSQSKSHQIFYKVIRKFPEFPSFQEFILTSPLGVIPRQLENIYPVNSYDISVTGDWDHEEIGIAAKLLAILLNKYENDIPIIAHLEGGYLEIIKRAIPMIKNEIHYSEITERVTSESSLASLQNLIKKYKNQHIINQLPLDKPTLQGSLARKVVKILDYQFGPSSGYKIWNDGLKFKKNSKTNQINLIDPKTKEDLGNFSLNTGQIFISIEGAKRLLPFSKDSKFLIFDGDKIKGNTLFRPGVLEYSSELIPKEIVAILNREKNKIISMGEMIIGSNVLKNSETGRVAKVYEKIG